MLFIRLEISRLSNIDMFLRYSLIYYEIQINKKSLYIRNLVTNVFHFLNSWFYLPCDFDSFVFWFDFIKLGKTTKVVILDSNNDRYMIDASSAL